MEVRSNPIVDRAEWERQRAAAAADPGRFHGGIAKRAIHWYDAGCAAWLTYDEPAGCWTGWSAADGEAVAVGDYGEAHEPWQRALDDDEPPFYGWFSGGLTNAAFNEVDRHVLAGHGDEAAFIVEGDHWDETADAPVVSFTVSRARLLLETVKAALVLGSLGLGKGDRVALNMPNIVEQVYFSEAAKRLGVIYTPVFGGFSAKTLSDRIADAGARVLVTADGGYRNGRVVPFKQAYSDPALAEYLAREVAEATVARTLAECRVAAEAAREVQERVGGELEGEVTVERAEVLRAAEPALRTLVDEGERVRAALAVALDELPGRVDAVVVVRHTGEDVPWQPGRDRWAHDLLAAASSKVLSGAGAASEEALLARPGPALWRGLNEVCPVEPVDADWPLFMIYTSGSTGKPKGVVHVHGGYVAGIAHTMRVSFDVVPGRDTIYVIADPGWITGQSYLISAALTTRTTSVLAEGTPLYPTAGRFASIIERYRVTAFKAGATFLRSVMSNPGNRAAVEAHDTSSLRVATFCAEPTSPVVQQFGMDVLCRQYINSYWATEHGGIVWTHFFGNRDAPLRADAHAYPLPWIFGDVWAPDGDGDDRSGHRRAADGERGELVIEQPYPYLARTVWGDPERLGRPGWAGDRGRWRSTYWERWSDALAYTQGDFARRHADGSFSFHGRSDDVINVAGHRIGTEEIEGAILRDKVLSPDSPVGNVVVVGAPHPQKGLTPVAFVQTADARDLTRDEERRLATLVRTEKGAVAVPSDFITVSELPETRSGKYVRRLLAALTQGADPGDLSSLRNPEVLREIEPKVTAWRDGRAGER
jgi:acrylyl-CoA reductase (NADPH) / 3-hydroxypropionyl-CoA dehydratase / 3-hydroxypropionyl-CoA synthetase